MVGAVLVKRGRVVGRGWHRRFGGPHAEVEAIRDAGRAARGAVMYVTLAPCGHHGKTPPCVDALLAAGVRRVVAAMDDPNPVAGRRWKRALKRGGVAAALGPCEAEALALNRPYLKGLREGLPFVTAKWAMTLDGKIATRTGDAKWISGAASRRYAHRLRDRSGAVVVGAATVRRDDPLLTCRLRGGRTPLRVVLASRADVPLRSHLARTAREHPVLIACGKDAPARRVDALRARGCEVVQLPARNGRVSLRVLLRRLHARGITHVLLEGGGRLLGDAFDAGLVDRVAVFVAPKIAGGADAVTAVAGRGVARIAAARGLTNVRLRRLGEDLLLEGDLAPDAAE
jgi:diaminohydroxyphosphoribosylaminopyrimidine deaminase/5-amino-6-(5-phosphoribosylamino)uracil reductase